LWFGAACGWFCRDLQKLFFGVKHLAEGDGGVKSGANHLIFSILMSLGCFTGIAIIYHFIQIQEGCNE
jgi:hypothetical protein